MTRAPFLLAALLLLAAGPTRADDRPPRFDVDGHCSSIANHVDGFDSGAMSRCLMGQGDALDTLQRLWPDTPTYIQDDCLRRARRGGGDQDYVWLLRCVRTQKSQEVPVVPGVTPGVPAGTGAAP